MPDGVFTNPALIDRFIRALVAGIRREPDSLRGIVDAAVDCIHAEGQEVAGLELRGEPASAKFLTERYGVVGELPAMLPSVVTGDVRATRIDIRVEIIADAVGLQVRFFEDHESTDFQGHFAVGNPCSVEAMCAAAHVNDVAMGGRSVTAAHRAKPDVVEVPNGSTEESDVELLNLGTEYNTVDSVLVFPGCCVEFGMDAFFQDAIDERLIFFKNPILGERLDESLASFEDDLTGEESFDIKVAVFIHGPLKSSWIVADGGGIIQPAEGMLIQLEFMTEGGECAVDDGC